MKQDNSSEISRLKEKYSHLYNKTDLGTTEHPKAWAWKMLIETGHDPADVQTMDFNEFNDKHNTIK